LAYRRPALLDDCLADVLLGIRWLRHQGKRRVVLVGHSFGGAVVITAGVAAGDTVIGVAALSSQTSGTQLVGALSPRKLLLVHGTADQVLPDACSRDLYARAREPKQLILYADCRHGLDECRDQLDRDLIDWLERVLDARDGAVQQTRDGRG
jgi:alpha-beta hydrolase superfamily lysophospholipase